jgi:hypothetical protein
MAATHEYKAERAIRQARSDFWEARYFTDDSKRRTRRDAKRTAARADRRAARHETRANRIDAE